jgi:hypothetical protein
MGRKDRCECAPTDQDARRCFWLSFDQQAFIAASLKTEDELRMMFRERLVWENPADIALLRSKGLLTRIYGPQVRFYSFLRHRELHQLCCHHSLNSIAACRGNRPSVRWTLLLPGLKAAVVFYGEKLLYWRVFAVDDQTIGLKVGTKCPSSPEQQSAGGLSTKIAVNHTIPFRIC